MDELKRKQLIRQIDKGWADQASYLLGVDESVRAKGKKVEFLLSLRDSTPELLLFILHPAIQGVLLHVLGPHLGKKVSKSKKEALNAEIREIISDLKEDGYRVAVPNDSVMSSLAFAELLIEEEILPEVLLKWDDDVINTLSMQMIAREIWNLINFYGLIEPKELLRIHAALRDEQSPLDEDMLQTAYSYITLNLSHDIFREEFGGVDYIGSEYMTIDADEILEDREGFEEDYAIPELKDLIEMDYGISDKDIMMLAQYIENCFQVTPEFEEILKKSELMHELIVALRGDKGFEIESYLQEEYGLEYEEENPQLRDQYYKELFVNTPLYGLKGHTILELGYEEEDFSSFDEGDLADDALLSDELPFRLLRPGDDQDNDDFLH